MLATRYECKYYLPAALVQPVRDYLRPFVEQDPHAVHIPDGTYTICSLYLDSSDLRLYEQGVAGHKNRFKLRIRTYGDAETDPVFFEVKKRMNGMVYKRRMKLARRPALEVVDGLSALARGDEIPHLRDIAEFAFLARAGKVVPIVRVKYRREAYEAFGPEPVRITFDTELQAADSPEGDICHGHGVFRDVPLEGVILEVKFTERYPPWVGDFIRTFELQKQSISKYVNSLADRVGRGPLIGAAPYLA